MTLSVGYQRKRALIIGINEYKRDSLNFCINDAKDLNKTLESIDFKVSLGVDCDLTDFYRTVDTFIATLHRDDLVLFYFAGHGMQNEDDNYLLPSDYDYDHRGSERDYIEKHAVNVKYIMKKIDDKKCRITIYVFDCCRHRVRTRSIKSNEGLLPMTAPPQTLIVYACAPGKAVLDETRNDRNGSFIENLLKYIRTANQDIEDIMKNVATEVYSQTAGVQLPYRQSCLIGKVCLVTNDRQETSPSSASANMVIYSDQKIRCRGRACASCGKCRDWYWRYVDKKMRHKKRNDAICALMDPNYYNDDGAYRDGDFHTVCECDDNRV